ncbi:MAG: hypothetical protein IPF92_12895 [Myxococcales bacterium]|nr:hypothetical protein [Myxococcales bacterium]MBL0197357.1 hypothetical protein [Myxococcales bacterium]HQY62075.1 hypothetical protein [Polyangiaceae bacterium]
MKRNLAPARLGAATAALALGLAVLLGQASCSNQSEGQRCNILGDNAGNDDCQEGLVCKPKGQLNGAQDDLCCPLVGAPTVAACQAPGGGAVVPVPAEAGPTPDATPADASGDAPADAPAADTGADAPAAETGADASTDAPIDGG